MRSIDRLIIHCTATRPGQVVTVDEVRQWHKARGWSDIGYHALIHRDGVPEYGRPVSRMGAHVRGHNRGSLGIALVGGHGAAATDHFHDHFTEEQRRTLASICLIAQGFGLTIHGHNEFANKGCPGFSVAGFLKGAA